MRWATRHDCHVDRTACAWLIERFIDHDAEFLFVDELIDVPDDATPFDMRGAELSHREGDCTFERLLRLHQFDDEALWRIAAIIHEADIGDERYDAPEAPGLDLAIRGLGDRLGDPELLKVSRVMFEGIYLALAS
jgi:hypothetical protein